MNFFRMFDTSTWFLLGVCSIGSGMVLGILSLLPRRGHEKPVRPLHASMSPGPQAIATQRGQTQVFAHSIIGTRKSQQDYVYIPDASLDPALLLQRGKLCLVCDGMGGMQGGEQASRQCAQVLYSSFYQGPDLAPVDFFRQAIPKANQAVAALKDSRGQPLGGGTTLVCAILQGNRMYYASVGDSRIYLFRKGVLSCLTRDHNYLLTLMEKVRGGALEEEEARRHPKREALISYIGIGDLKIVDIAPEPLMLASGDVVLLCSDGLYKSLSHGEISAALASHAHAPEGTAQCLTAAAAGKKERSLDNTSVVIISCT